MNIQPTPEVIAGTGLAVYAGKAAIDGARAFFQRIAGPAAEELGLLIQDKVKSYRAALTVRTAIKAAEMLREAGRDAGPVPPRVLLPLLDGASVEDDANLSERWAALLANAADAAGPGVAPSFPFILRQLSPLDAFIVELLISRGENEEQMEVTAKRMVLSGDGNKAPPWGLASERIAELLDEPLQHVKVALNNLEGLGLVEIEPQMRRSAGNESILMATLGRGCRLSSLGTIFANACRAPEPSA
jgi:hypothetical protein